MFEGVFEHAGKIRIYNISKKEWVLKGDTVIYAAWNSIKETLDYDFSMEKQFSYEGLSLEESARHLAKFTSNIWQIHPFKEEIQSAKMALWMLFQKFRRTSLFY